MAQTQLETRKIASRYAKALLDAAEEQGKLDKVTQAIETLQQLYQDVPELDAFCSNPAVPGDEKREIIQKHFKKLEPLVENLLTLLQENDRLGILSQVVAAYIGFIHQREGIAKAEVIVPVALTDKLEKQFSETLEKIFGYQQVEITTKVDPAIIAGAIVKIGDKIIDGSYHGKLEMLRRQVG